MPSVSWELLTEPQFEQYMQIAAETGRRIVFDNESQMWGIAEGDEPPKAFQYPNFLCALEEVLVSGKDTRFMLPVERRKGAPVALVLSRGWCTELGAYYELGVCHARRVAPSEVTGNRDDWAHTYQLRITKEVYDALLQYSKQLYERNPKTPVARYKFAGQDNQAARGARDT